MTRRGLTGGTLSRDIRSLSYSSQHQNGMDLRWVALLIITTFEAVADEDDHDCMPQLANRCFSHFYEDLPSQQCQLYKQAECSLGLATFCSTMIDRLQCSSDIIDSDCKPDEGQTNFDSWLRGLKAIQKELCRNDGEMLKVFLQSSCFSRDDFIECVGDMTNITHATDLLHVILNKNECSWVMIALPTCNIRANTDHSTCHQIQGIINDLIFTFFANTECGQTCQHTSSATHHSPLFNLILPLILLPPLTLPKLYPYIR